MAISYDELVNKAMDQSLTVREAIDYAMSKPNVTDNHFKQLRALKSQWEKTGLPEDITLAEMRKEENWSRLGKDVNKHSNKFGNFQALELNIRPVLEEAGVLNTTVPGPGGKGEIRVYPLITGGKGSGSLSGGAQRTGLAGERPMRGLIPQDDIEKIYSEAIPQMRSTYGDAVADLAEYHKATFQRPEQLVGDSAITKADVTITDDYVTIKGVTKGKKTRPTVKYPVGSPMADLVIRNYESSKSEKLFDVKLSTYDEAYRKTISPKLVAGFEDVLPLFDAKDPSKGVISSPSATRSFMARILTDELGYPDDVAEAMMGHTDSSILSRNYRGLKPVEGMGKIADSLLIGVRDKFGGFGEDAANFTSTLTEEQRRDLAEAQVAEAKNKTATYLSETLEKEKDRVAYLESDEGQKFLEGKDALERQEITRKLELQQFEKEERARIKAESAPVPDAPTVVDDDAKKAMNELADFFNQIGSKAGKGLKIVAPYVPVAGLGLAYTSKKAEAEEMISAGSGTMPAYLQKGAEFIAEEFTPYGTAKDVVDLAGMQAEAYTSRGKELLEKSTTQTQEELLQSFGQFGAEVRGIK